MRSLSYMPQLDGLRMVAVFWVMLYHFTAGTRLFYYFGYLASDGVTMFFVLSGFLITQILIKAKEEHSGLKRFYIRRFFRIFPIYYLVVFLCIGFDVPNARPYTGWLLTYTANFPAGFTQFGLRYLNHLWSLSVEEQFYVFFPLLIMLTGRRVTMLRVLLFLSILSRVIIFFSVPDQGLMQVLSVALTPCCFDAFAIGALLAHYRMQGKIPKIQYPFVLCGIACFLIPFIFPRQVLYSFGFTVFFRTAFSLFCFWLIARASEGEIWGLAGRFLCNRFVIYLGKISYGMYVYHLFMPYIFRHVRHGVYLYVPATILISAISWHFYERPISRFGNRLSDRGTKHQAVLRRI